MSNDDLADSLTESAIERLHREMDAKDARIEKLEAALPWIAASPSGKERSEMVGRLLTPEDGEQPS